MRKPIASAAAALLTVSAAACSAQSKPHTFQATTADYRIGMDLDSTSMGQRTATFHLARVDGRTPDIRRLTLTPIMKSMGMTGAEIQARPTRPDEFQATGDLFAMEGTWVLSVTIADDAGQETAAIPVTATP